MGNFLGLKENKYNKTNINIFEKRYGYNLNDLHSYVYKINLPLKPRYVSYVLQEKGKRASGEEPNGVPPDGDLPNVTSHLDCEADSMDNTSEGKQFLAPVDIYNRYDRDNLHNSSNIYQNKLKINQKGQEEDHQKYEDMYVHMSYDNKYIYDQHKNNIYEEYINVTKKEGVKKTYANLCLNYYNNLDTCMIKKYQKNVQNRKYKFTRLHTCKPHYILFSRCVMYRDKKLMNEIKKVELNYYNSLSRDSRSLYLNEFTTNLNYHEYLISKMHDGVEKIKIKKELDELRERYNHIVKYANAGFTEAPTFEAPQETTYLNEKKYILLNL